MKRYTIGADIGGTKKAYGLFDGDKKLVGRLRTPSDPKLGPELFFDGVYQDIQRLLRQNGLTLEHLEGVGVAMPSFILQDKGHIVMTSSLPKIDDFPAREYMKEKLKKDIPVLLVNDAQSAALAEHRYGAGRGFPHMLYCPISTGIAAGIIIDGKPFRGSYGWAEESGHAIITPGEGILCGCKNRGCFMSYISGRYIVQHVQSWIDAGETTEMVRLAGGAGQITAKHIQDAYALGDALAIRAVEQMAHYLSVFLFNLFVTLNINCYVFGGGMVKFGEILFDRVREKFDRYNHIDVPVHFKFAELGQDTGVIGANEFLY